MKPVFYALIMVLFGVVIYNYNLQFDVDSLQSYLIVLLSVSSMVFTVMGLWIAFLYPNALRRIVDSNIETADFSETLNETRRLEGLVGTVLRSAFVVIVVVLILFLLLVVETSTFYEQHHVRTTQFIVLLTGLMTLLQIESIGSVLLSNVMFLHDLHSKREDREGDRDI